MCRWAAYRGEPLYLEELVSSPAHSLIEQSHCATRAKTATNGDGFGIAWYGDHPEPGRYRDILPAWSDCNLKSIARQIRSPLFLAHVRAATGGGTRRDNCHPFVHGRWSFMHNGQIGDFEHLRRPMEAMLDNDLYTARTGSTDSELLFLLALQFGLEQDPLGAIAETLAFVERLAEHLERKVLVRFTAALSDGHDLYAVRYASDWPAPTREAAPLGPSGGYGLGAEPRTAADPEGVKVIHVERAEEMRDAVIGSLPADIAVMVAAVADWRVASASGNKIKKQPGEAPPPLLLTENPDILKTIGHHAKRPKLVVGFAAETQNVAENGRSKLERKGADYILANDVSPHTGIMGGDRNTVKVIGKLGDEDWPEMDKQAVAERLGKLIASHFS